MPTWNERFPFLSSAAKLQLDKRFRACLPAVTQAFGWTPEQAEALQPLGCGNYGCTYLVPGAPQDRAVVKVTTDNLEAHTVNLLLGWGEEKPEGIVHYHGIWQLGQCSVLPKMRAFEYKKHTSPSWDPKVQTVHYRGPGAPYRPVWVISREELPDAWAELQRRGVKQGMLREKLNNLWRYATGYAYQASAPGGIESHSRGIDYDAVAEMLAPVHGVALLEAITWLIERSIGFYDFQKIVNLGWREGTGLVIRDIGFASTQMLADEDPATLGCVCPR